MTLGKVCPLFLVLLFLAPPPVANAQPENARKAAKSLQLKEPRNLYTAGLDLVGEKVDAGTWLIEQNRRTRNDGCEKNRWVTVKYTEDLARTVEAPGNPESLYFCDNSEADTKEVVARPLYNFRALLGGTGSIKNDGRALFREVKEKHRPLLESLRRDIQSGRVELRVQVNIAETTLSSDTLTVSKRGIRIPMGTKVEKSAEERRATFNWSGTGVTEDHAPDYANIPGRPETATVKASNPAESDDLFSWWALALIGILSILAGALGLFLYLERKEKDAIREKKNKLMNVIEKRNTLKNNISRLEEKIGNIEKRKKKRRKVIRELSNLVQYTGGERKIKRNQSTSIDSPESYNLSDEESEIRLLKEIKNRLDVSRKISDLKEELFDWMQETQETRKDELRSLLREELPEKADQRMSPETIELLREESEEKTDERVGPQDIEELSHKIDRIESLLSNLEERERSKDEDRKGNHLVLRIAELQEKSSPLSLRSEKQETSEPEDLDKQDGSPWPSPKAPLNSVDRTELLDHVKYAITRVEQEEQQEVPKLDTQTDTIDSISEEGSSEDEAKKPEEKISPSKVDSDFKSVLEKCKSLMSKYRLKKDDPQKLSIIQGIFSLMTDAKSEYEESILNSEDAAMKLARIFSQVWSPKYPRKSLEVLNEITSDTEIEWKFHHSPEGVSHSYEDLRCEAENAGNPILKIAVQKINKEMEKENFQKNEMKTITPGIEWEGRGEGQEFSYRQIRYRADYRVFEKEKSSF